jgi:branched-chain amino acid transport system permease protein
MSTATQTPTTDTSTTELTAEVDTGRARGIGLNVGAGMIIVCAVGMAVTFDNRTIIDPILSMAWLTLGLAPFLGGWIAAKREQLEGVETAPPGLGDVGTAALSGLWAGGLFAVFIIVLDAFGATLRGTLVQLSPRLLELLTFGRGVGFGIAVAVLMSVTTGALGGLLRINRDRFGRAVTQAIAWIFGLAVLQTVVRGVLDSLYIEFIADFLYARPGGLSIAGAVVVAVLAAAGSLALSAGKRRTARRRQRGEFGNLRNQRIRLYVGLVAAAIVLPYLFGRSVNDMLINVVIFGIMAMGLNIVIGLTGMLDLGYVAFFAVGAYTTAVLTAPASNLAISPEISFWLALPIALAVAVVAGLIIGTPVIRLRGDYLAIVTLGFAAIAQVLVLSDWFSPVLGGPQGVRNVPPVPLGITEVSATVDPRGFLWLCLAFLALMIYVAWRLQHSRLGRAWQAIREDETVAEAMGINVGAMKLLSFIVGAVFAALAGGLFAAKVSSAFPTSFELLVSVLVLVVVIVGGTGYVPGVLLGSLVLVGVLGGPTTQGLLAEFAQYKLLIYGALLVVMMLVRPQGLMPKPDREREVAQEEMDQDAWFDKNVGGSSGVASSHRADAAGEVPIETRLRPDDGTPASDHDTAEPGEGETTITTDPTEGEA